MRPRRPSPGPILTTRTARVSRAFADIGAPGFEPGTSPTRIMGEICGCYKKYLQIDGFRLGLTSSQSSDIAVDSRGFGREMDSLPNGEVANASSPAGSARSLPRSRTAAWSPTETPNPSASWPMTRPASVRTRRAGPRAPTGTAKEWVTTRDALLSTRRTLPRLLGHSIEVGAQAQCRRPPPGCGRVPGQPGECCA